MNQPYGSRGDPHPPYQGGIKGGSAPPLSRGDQGGIRTPLIKGGLRGDPHPPYQGGIHLQFNYNYLLIPFKLFLFFSLTQPQSDARYTRDRHCGIPKYINHAADLENFDP